MEVLVAMPNGSLFSSFQIESGIPCPIHNLPHQGPYGIKFLS
jgi:hypothetical protein